MCVHPQIVAALVAVAGISVTFGFNFITIQRNRRHERDGVIAALCSDINSIIEAIYITKLVDSFIKTYDSPDTEPIYPPWSDSPRKENYFSLYESLADQIGKIPPKQSIHIVRFYTFLRISRDAAAPFGKMESKKCTSGAHREHARNVLLSLREMFNSGQIAISDSSGPSKPQPDGAQYAQELAKKISQIV